MPVSLLICGDTVPTQSNFREFAAGDRPAYVSDALWARMEEADLRFYNLEVPLCDVSRPIVKCGPNLIAPRATAAGLEALKPDLVGLANNHILDQDAQGLYSTLEALDSRNIPHVGAGADLAEAAKPWIFEKDGLRIGLYNCAEHEFTIAGENSPGANPFDPFESPDHIRELKARCDYVVVIYHGLKEHYRYPSPKVRRACRKMVEWGADLVVCQHSHCVGCMEEYRGGTVVYGQGNFIFDHKDNEFWRTSLLIKATFDRELRVEYIPVRRENKGVGLGDEAILQGFYDRSREITREGFVEANYEAYALSMINEYYVMLTADDGVPFSDEVIADRAAKADFAGKYHPTFLSAMENIFRCEAHNELIQAALHKLTGSGVYRGQEKET